MDGKEIQQLVKSLSKASANEEVHNILKILHEKVEPTAQLLRETKLGLVVNGFRSHPDPKVAELVRVTVKAWRDNLTSQKSGAKPKSAAATLNRKGSTSATLPANKPANGDQAGTPTQRTAKSDKVNVDIYDDKVRNSCLEVTYNALCLDNDAPPDQIIEISKSIEQYVHKAEKGTSASYKAKMRSLYVNLKNKQNPQLRSRVISGQVSPERLYNMSPQELAPEKLKEEIHELEKKNLFNARGAKEQRATTDRFTCGKCKQKKVSYYQMQTRSADEPLTTFCTCENCGNRWKFS
ncbi:hypothetical protein CANCADRAFT_1801 [Tortispora caseinolytica NRRL Y-17796]|uniref:Transcription elongation factor n=1 Tax=Tortispora caseinolytica NRRL Y-17796 TaxID=767744 RepID=A0A1E4TEF5_9ASCO|nr:hypothetical protein CANCADRAFT_1801 [Tortispora caseinolytica NRRL Y-17796]